MNKLLFLENNKAVFDNGVFGIAYKLELPEKFSLGKEDYTDLNNYWHSALKDLPINTVFFKQDIFLEKKYSTEHFKEDNFLQKDTKKYFSKWDYLEHNCYLFFLLPSQEINNTNLINPFARVTKKTFESFDDTIESFIESVESVILSLKSIKLKGGNTLKLTDFEEVALKNYYELYFNLFDSQYISDIQVNNNNINIGEKYASLVCLLDEDKLPEHLDSQIKDKTMSNDKTEFFRNYGDNFSFDLDFSHIYNQIVIIDDNRKHLNDLKIRNVKLHKMQGFDTSNKFFAKATDEIIEHITTNLDTVRLVRAHNNIIVIANNEEELSKNVLKTIEAFRDIEIKPYIPTGNYLIALFNYSFPFYTQYLTDKQYYVASLEIFCSFLSNTTDFKNDDVGVLYNSRLSNLPVLVDTWDEKKKNINARNFFILAPTGHGKSFNANHIVRTYFERGTKIVIVDLGGSYKKLSALYPNDTAYITYKEGDSIGINPFDKSETDVIGSDKIEELVNFIAIHYKRDSEITEIEKTSLRKIVEYYYKEIVSDYSMVNFICFIKDRKETLLNLLAINSEFFNINEFLHLMSEFIDTGVYSFLYKSNESTLGRNLHDKGIIIFELDAVRNNPLLLTIMLNLVSTTIDKVIWKDKSTKGIVLFDEVAEQLKWNGVLRMIGYFYQAIRKQGGAVGMILQSESQLPDNDISKAIVENTQVLYVLYAMDYRSLQKRFKLSEHAYYQLCSMQSNFSSKIPYSEIFIMRGNTHQVYRFIAPKKVYWAYQTEGIENQNLLNIYEETNDMEKAINQYINLNS
ncbi:TraG family conjugative transposon ATPase [Flavobacterium psychrophilum]|uniref:TraG family conjugative transposon ATPase n=1 Tax=Flavobacterium psychrophilum TaxID=96345 RepID=UPI001069D660|nr:TraG family conjugative transposon ATPase [Flavobacterium psychrophilum]